jgi:nucleosome assembly protein 1-like 1
LKDPLSDRRKSLVTGKAQPTSNEVYTGGMAFTVLDPDYTPSPPIEDLLPFVNGVPDFWLTAIQNHEHLSGMINDEDEEALKSLIDIKVIYTGVPRKATTCDGVKPNYKLSFHFLPNPFFHDSVLTKEYFYKSGSQPHSFVFYRAVGTNIRWKSQETDLTHSGDSALSSISSCSPSNRRVGALRITGRGV